jgi:uncharacterized membrane protein
MATLVQDPKIDIGNVIQRGFSVLGGNAPGFLLMSFLFAGLPAFVAQYLGFGSLSGGWPSLNSGMLALAGIFFLISIFATFLLQAALMRSSILSLSGRPADIAGSIAIALGLVLPMIGLAIVSTIAIGLAMLLLVVPGIMLYVAWIVAVPVLVEERAGVFGSLGRSAELTRGSRWRIFALVLIYFVAAGIVGGLFGIVAPQPLEAPLLSALLNALSSTVTSLIGAVMLASLYLELRTVKEGASADGLAAIFA